MAGGAVVVLVTGGTGFLASHTIDLLLQQGYSVRTSVRDPTNKGRCPQLHAAIAAGEPLELVKAELDKEDGWAAAVAGAMYVIHMASPLFCVEPKDEDEAIKPARDGTLFVLRAAARAGVKRVVLTSSTAAVFATREEAMASNKKALDDATFADPEQKGAGAYCRSKIFAERAAWEFMKTKEASGMELVVLCPSAVTGPVLNANLHESMTQALPLLQMPYMFIPKFCLPLVDVRDVAEANVRAMVKPEAAGQRYLLFGESVQYIDLARQVARVLRPLGYCIPTFSMPTLVGWALAPFIPSLGGWMQYYDVDIVCDSSKVQRELGLEFRDVRQAFFELCISIIEQGIVPKTKAYVAAQTLSRQLAQ